MNAELLERDVLGWVRSLPAHAGDRAVSPPSTRPAPAAAHTAAAPSSSPAEVLELAGWTTTWIDLGDGTFRVVCRRGSLVRVLEV